MVNAANNTIRVFIIAGGSYVQREQEITSAIQKHKEQSTAIILEGLPNGSPLLLSNDHLLIERIAPGCFCCIGQLVLQVSLNRLIRKKPNCLYIGMQDIEHVHFLYQRLSQNPYQSLLTLENVLKLP